MFTFFDQVAGNDRCTVPSLNLMRFTRFPELQLFLFALFAGLADSRVSAKHPKSDIDSPSH